MATTTTTTEESSSVSPASVAPQQPDLETSIEPNLAAKADCKEARCDRKEKEDDEEEEGGGGGGSAVGQENPKRPNVDPDWVEERFRIDRKKLETMLYGE